MEILVLPLNSKIQRFTSSKNSQLFLPLVQILHNKEYVDENKLLIDDFKNYVKIFIDVDKYNEKSKKGSIEFIGFKFKEEHLLVTQPIEIEINIPNVIQKKKKVINKTINKQSKLVIDEEVDNSILDQ